VCLDACGCVRVAPPLLMGWASPQSNGRRGVHESRSLPCRFISLRNHHTSIRDPSSCQGLTFSILLLFYSSATSSSRSGEASSGVARAQAPS
jgi:hypothetical protein